MSFRRLAREEIRARRDRVGKVLSTRRILDFSTSTPVWVVNVDVGGERVLRDVPVKAFGALQRTYAVPGQSVNLKRNTQGRYDVVGPADAVVGTTVAMDVDLDTQTGSPGTDFGFSPVVRPHTFYQGPVRLRGNPNLTFDQVPAGNDTLVRSAGSWVDDGFQVGDDIEVGGSLFNDTQGDLGAPYTVAAISTTTNPDDALEFAGDVLTDEGPSNDIFVALSGGALWNDGVNGYPKTSIVDAQGNEV